MEVLSALQGGGFAGRGSSINLIRLIYWTLIVRLFIIAKKEVL